MLMKFSYIRQLSDGQWRVFSRKNKNLGTYSSKEEARQRLNEIEMFKHMKKNKKRKRRKRSFSLFNHMIRLSMPEPTNTYSSAMRDINKNCPEKREVFMRRFKDAFDNAMIDEIDAPEDVALMEALQYVDIDSKGNNA